MFNFKKIVAGIAVGAMVMGSGVAAFAGNGIVATDGKTVQFAAQYKDGTWAAAPYDMNDANIASATALGNDSYLLALKEGSYVMPYATMGGVILSVTDASGAEVSTDIDGDGYADYATMTAGESNKYTLNLKTTSGESTHSMNQVVYLMAN